MGALAVLPHGAMMSLAEGGAVTRMGARTRREFSGPVRVSVVMMMLTSRLQGRVCRSSVL